MADYAKTARDVLKEIGGPSNVKTVTHCMTRLRFGLVSDKGINDEAVKKIPGVLGVVRQGGQYQVIIGNSVPICFAEVQKLLPSEGGSTPVEEKKKFTLKGWGASILDTISGSIAPLIPVILGCGMVKILLLVLDMVGVSSGLPTYKILTIIGDAGYYFLPLLIAYSASKKMGCSTPLAMTIVAVLVHPDLITMLNEGSTSFLMIPVTSASYSSTVIPALLSVWLLSKVEPITDKYLTEWRRTLLKPMVILLVCVPISLIVLAPLGMLIGNGMAAVLSFMYSKAPWLTLGVYSALLPLVVMAGMHVAVFPYIFSNLDTLGYDYLQLPAMLAYNLGQAAAALAVSIKTKNKDLKATAVAAAVSAGIGGVTEPALYGVTLRLRKPLIASMIASGITGVFIGVVKLKAFAFSGPCLVSFPMFASTEYTNNFLLACIAAVLSVVLTVIFVLLLGWDDPVEEEENAASPATAPTASVKPESPMQIASPLYGEVVPLSQVKDATFAEKILGDGAAVVPNRGEIVAPFDGAVSSLLDTSHAIGITSADSSVELLIHVGMDTVNLNGEGFHPQVHAGDTFRKGDVLLKFDLNALKEKGYDVTTPVIVTDSAYSALTVHDGSEVSPAETLLTLA